MKNHIFQLEHDHNRTSKQKALFILKIALALTVAFAISVLMGKAVRGFVKPPDIPQDEAPNLDDFAFLPPQGEEEDMHIGGGLHAPEGFTADDRKEQFYTFLIIGMDEGVNTDTIMVASYDSLNNEANIISIPRDSLVNVKRTVKKINAAYPAGTLHGGGREGGIAQLQREIKTIVGFVPDFTICIDLNAFVRIVDAINGITVDIPMDLKYDDPMQDLHIDIKKGEQRLDGETALKFTRYRKGNNSNQTITDYQRIGHQQTVVKAVLAELVKPANIVKIPEFIRIVNEYVYSDISAGNMLWFASQLNAIRGTEALSMYTIPTIGTSGLPMWYEYLDRTGIVELVNRTVNPYRLDIEAKDLDIIIESD